MKLYDISPLLHPGIAVWPGDRPFARRVSLEISQGDSVNLSSMECSLHVGSHADAPCHVVEEGKAVDEMELMAFLGPAKLITLARGREPITQDELTPVLREPVERLLIRCHPDANPDVFPNSIRFFTPEAAEFVGESGVLLIGTDAPSVDPLDAKELVAHKAFFRSGVSILENLLLQDVEDGDYELIALPLRIAGGDAAPLRAVLRRP